MSTYLVTFAVRRRIATTMTMPTPNSSASAAKFRIDDESEPVTGSGLAGTATLSANEAVSGQRTFVVVAVTV